MSLLRLLRPLSATLLLASARVLSAQTPVQPPPPCHPQTVLLSAIDAAASMRVTLRLCRHPAGMTELLAEAIDSLPRDSARAVSRGTMIVSAHDASGSSWRFTIDGAARRGFVERVDARGQASPVSPDSAPWRASVLLATNNEWRVHAMLAPILRIDGLRFTATDGSQWIADNLEQVAVSTALGATAQPAAQAPLPPRSRSSVTAIGNVATPAPFAPRPGARASLGVIASHASRGQEITAGLAPPRPVFEWAPIQANPNQRGRRVLRDGRPEMEPWRMERGRFVWLDTRRIDRGLGFVHVHGNDAPVGALFTVAENGDVSSAAARLGRYDRGPLVLRVAALRDEPRAGYRAKHPWLMIGGVSGTLGGSDRAPSASAPATPRPSVNWEWNATAPAGSPDLRRGASLVTAYLPLPRRMEMSARHERLSPGFGSRGASFAALDGIEIAELAFASPVRGSHVVLGADVLAPFRQRDALSGAPFDDDSRELRGRARWILPRSQGSSLALESTVGSYRYGDRRLGPYPGGSVTWTAAPWHEWRMQLLAHAEGTPLFAVLAPARATGLRTSAERRTTKDLTAFFVAAERVDKCGNPLFERPPGGTSVLPPASATNDEASGCDVAGDVLAASVLHSRRLWRAANMEVEGRWQRQRANVRDIGPALEGPSRFEWRAVFTTPLTSGVLLSASSQCGLENPRATCDMSLVLTRSLFSRQVQ